MLRERALPWLDRHPTWTATLARLESAAPSDRVEFTGPPRLTAMWMRLARGEHDAAERDFREYMVMVRAEGCHPGHLRYLGELAEKHEFDVQVPLPPSA